MSGLEKSQRHLAEVPTMAALYAKGASQSVRQRVPIISAIGQRDVLPDRMISTEIAPDPDQVVAYQQFFGLPAGAALPAGYLHVLAFPLSLVVMTEPGFPLPLLGMVHTKNTIDVHRLPEIGEVLDVSAWADNLRPHRKGTEVDLCAEIYSGSELLWKGTSTYLSRGRQLGVSVETLHDGAEVHSRREFVAPAATEVWRLAGDIGRKYASLSGDVNPIHLSPFTARVLGFRRAIAHGMYTASRALASIDSRLPGSYRWSIEFAAPVLIPGTVHVRSVSRDDTASGGDIETVAWDDRRGKPHFTATVGPLRPA
ncbi:hypothetical protein JT358_06350 [Micrococcales bacterium 31B]|nr:hypothetical protein [Micrococcales bacterium 31B]